MCGITGMVSIDGAPVDPGVLEAMSDAILHRGPDSGGMHVDGRVGIAARRLAIIDLEGGDQPIANEDGRVHVVQNGEIYNFQDLRSMLRAKGHTFRTRSDTEALVHLYEERGPMFAESLRGMFAVAIWDARHGRLVLARDRFGIKPLYYRFSDGWLSFGSELKCLVRQPGFPRDIDPDAVDAFLAYSCIPAPLTIFSHARKLPAGHVLVWEASRPDDIRIERYARPLPAPATSLRRESERDLAVELRERLRESVRAHLIADVPVGVLLSGGIDSSALTAFAATEGTGQVSTFSIGFEEKGFDERDLARMVARRYATDHHELVLQPDSVELLPQLATIFDEPFADSSAIPTLLVSQLARETVKVALSGEGGDELFGGYNYYTGHLMAPRFGGLATAVRPLVDRLPTSTKRASTLDYKAKRFVSAASMPPLERHHMWKSTFSPAERDELLVGEWRPEGDPIDLLRPRYRESSLAEPLARIMDVDLSVFLVEDMLVKTDRTSMARSLETRVPFLDTRLSDFALGLPTRAKVRGLSKKRLLRLALEPLVPKEILSGTKKGFSIPVASWLREDLAPLVRDALSPDVVRRQGVFDPVVVTRLVDEHTSGGRDLGNRLWALLVFSMWHDRYASA